MKCKDLKITNGATAGAWIRPRLGGAFGAVTLQVPTGFEAYARIFHPALSREQRRTTWAEVAHACGTTPHRQMQWHAILGLSTVDDLRGSYQANDGSGVQWTGADPPVGAMDIETLDALCAILDQYTPDASHCFFGLCTINGWLEALPQELIQPLLRLPYDRSHIVLEGKLTAVDQIAYDWGAAESMRMDLTGTQQSSPQGQNLHDFTQREAPSLIWPADHSWLVASEVDFDSTLIGGPSTLIRTIIASPKLEAWQVQPDDLLSEDADNALVRNG